MPKKVIIKTGATGTSQTSGQLSKIDKAMGAMAKSAGLVAAAYGAIRVAQKAMELGKIGATAEVVESKFQKLIKQPDELLRRMKIASAGTISELKLMQQANAAALLGVPLDQFDDMLTIARSAAQATGESMEFMLTSIVTGIGRGSKLMLDNLGILISQETANQKYAKSLGVSASALTDVQRKQAFANEAVRVGLENVKKAGGVAGTSADSYDQLTTSVDDLSVAFGQRLNVSMSGIAGYMADIVNSMTDILVVTKEEQLTSVMSNLEVITKQYNITSAELADAEQTRKKQAIATNKVWGGETAQMLIKVRDNYQSAAASSDDLGVSDENLAKKRERLSQLNNLMLADQNEIIRLNKEINAAKKEEAENTEAVTEAVTALIEPFDAYILKQQEDIALKQQESEWLAIIIDQYPELAKQMGLVDVASKKVEDSEIDKSIERGARYASQMSTSLAASFISGDDVKEALKRAVIQMGLMVAEAKIFNYLMQTAVPGGGILAGIGAFLGFEKGGKVPEYLAGGGFPSRGTDTIPAMLTPGEFVMNRDTVNRIGSDVLAGMNSGKSSGGITLVFNSPVTNADFVRDVIVPEIERAQRLA